MKAIRIGVIGLGFIGRQLLARIQAHEQMTLAFAYNRSDVAVFDNPETLRLRDLNQFRATDPTLIVEAAHPSITQQFGQAFLEHCDYMPISTTALIDDQLRASLLAGGAAHGHQLYLAAGALVGGNALAIRAQSWKRVRVTFSKHPNNLDFSDVATRADDIVEATTIFEGSVRDIAAKFPRNVNTMVTCALLANGLDACEGVLVADPTLDCAIAKVEAWGIDGSYICTEKRAPMVGVSGTEMVDSVWASVQRAARVSPAAMAYV